MKCFVLKVLLSAYDNPLFISRDILPKLTPNLNHARVFNETNSLELQYELTNYIYYLNRTYFPQHYGEITRIDRVDVCGDKENDK